MFSQISPPPPTQKQDKSVDDLTGLLSGLKTDDKGKTVAANEPLDSSLPAGQSQAMIATKASLHLFDQKSNAFVPKVEDVDVRVVQIGTYKCKLTKACVFGICHILSCNSLSDWLSVSQAKKPLIAQLLEPSMNPVFNREHSAFIWNYYEGSQVYSWLLQFPDKQSLEDFKEMFGRCIFEALNETPFSKFEVSICNQVVKWCSRL
jgi:hypothetical protein